MIFEEVRQILARQLEIPPENITMDTDIIADLGADSLDVVELVMMIEEKYGIMIEDHQAKDLYTVRQIVDFIEKLQ